MSDDPYMEERSRYQVPNYSRVLESPQQQKATAKRKTARKRQVTDENVRTLGGNAVPNPWGGVNWHDAGSRFIGTAADEISPINFVRPRYLNRQRYS